MAHFNLGNHVVIETDGRIVVDEQAVAAWARHGYQNLHFGRGMVSPIWQLSTVTFVTLPTLLIVLSAASFTFSLTLLLRMSTTVRRKTVAVSLDKPMCIPVCMLPLPRAGGALALNELQQR